jgi:hypothetical protein
MPRSKPNNSLLHQGATTKSRLRSFFRPGISLAASNKSRSEKIVARNSSSWWLMLAILLQTEEFLWFKGGPSRLLRHQGVQFRVDKPMKEDQFKMIPIPIIARPALRVHATVISIMLTSKRDFQMESNLLTIKRKKSREIMY